MGRILVIAPYPGLKDTFLEVNQEMGKEIHVEVGDLYKGLTIAKSMEEGFDVIISRGATARLLREHCNLPVVEVKISGYDILRTLTLVKGYPGKIGLMSYLNTIQGADAIGTLLEMNLSFFPIGEEKEIESGIKKAVEQGVQVIIGDVISTSVATQLGLHAILITSGREAVLESILEAEHMAYYTKREKDRIEQYEAWIDSYPEGIVAINLEDQVYVYNQKAEELLGVRGQDAIGRHAADLHHLLHLGAVYRKGKPVEEVVVLNGEKVMVRKMPVHVKGQLIGGLVILQAASSIQRAESQIRQLSSGQEYRARMHFNHLVATSEVMKETIRQAKQYSGTDVPLIIYGEPGVGKQSIAQAIHNAGPRRDYPFVFVNCEAYTEEQLEVEMLGSEGRVSRQGAFELAHGGTLFIDAIGRMPLSIQAKLINIIQEKKVIRLNGTVAIPTDIRIVAANSQDLKESMESGEFRKDLFHLINGGVLTIPPLRQRKQDIAELVRWFIASYNTRSGKQIVGFREEVMNMLNQAEWYGNVQELRSVVEKMCAVGSGPFIEQDEVEGILKELDSHKAGRSINNGLDIAGKTLEELEREIILQVLEEEGHNQSQAARRLGINRSTLWRKVKEFLGN
ncbi:PrpR N-terminal domain-containing protein [Brevibacillus humidisoli]|uniref:PrpR N-terminal domain-containing protein n=1 Tax=Brevibacillus humidisoli TaxID=2895522 RepID=UPI001E62EB1F|nr:PrpR N-terminal domain-containing protein [Brevibacillus humidisoli]UFJ41405.1 PrpR N-terminal domain-containing protein [Brevibacillus humidisoli]